jgi:hypothetical protein
MSARRFYFTRAVSAPVNPPFDTGWEQTGEALRGMLVPKLMLSALDALTNDQVTVPITTTQDILTRQFVSGPVRAGIINGTFSLVVRCSENATTNNATLAVVVNLVSQDGQTLRGALFSNFNQDTEFAVTASAATRIVNAQALTQRTAQDGDRIVVEIGVHAAGPTAAGSAIARFGTDAASDFALTSALTTDLNPWCEFSNDLWPSLPNNYAYVDSHAIPGNTGIVSFTEKIR